MIRIVIIAVCAAAFAPAAALAQQQSPVIIAPQVIPVVTAKQIIDRVAALGFRDVLQIRRTGQLVQVEALDAQGRAVDLYFDGNTGAQIK
ncbi:MAG: PepSY domain-containing protein [Alphaproteobacteria bacterium]|jgi:hypothetical protein|nr:PepSY domain-containing protein [Alphaproteobacteria bacterium]|tara:strand:+ start:868 stop:1137 length:270 start_codon:yes stop_codon:yes gene_type:complete